MISPLVLSAKGLGGRVEVKEAAGRGWVGVGNPRLAAEERRLVAVTVQR